MVPIFSRLSVRWTTRNPVYSIIPCSSLWVFLKITARPDLVFHNFMLFSLVDAPIRSASLILELIFILLIS